MKVHVGPPIKNNMVFAASVARQIFEQYSGALTPQTLWRYYARIIGCMSCA